MQRQFFFAWARKTRILESIFSAKQGLITRASFVYKTLRLVRISLLISVPNKRVLLFFSWKLCHKSNRKLFPCVCISWYKHSRGWENSRQLCKPSTSSRVCITVSNSPNPLVLILGYGNMENIFYCLILILCKRKSRSRDLYKPSRLVRISLLIGAGNRKYCFVLSGKTIESR